MAPVQPNPTRTTSTDGSFVATAHSSGFGWIPAGPPHDADGRQRQPLIVLLDVRPIVVVRAREADQLPTNHVAVAAVERIAEEALDGVLQEHLKERLRLDLVELDVALLQSTKHLILLLEREVRERLAAEALAAMVVDLLDGGAIELRRRHARLEALRLLALGPGTLHVPALCRTE